MRKSIKYILWGVVLVLAIYLSLDIQKLDQYKEAHSTTIFDAEVFVRNAWENNLPPVIREAPGITTVREMLDRDPGGAFSTYGRKLGISKTWYFMAQGTGIIESVEEDFVRVRVDSQLEVELATGFIFGNEVRDGSGVVDIDEFVNMTDFNNVSIAFNNRVKKEVVPGLVSSAVPGKEVQFTGAFSIVEDAVNTSVFRIVPLQITIADGSGE